MIKISDSAFTILCDDGSSRVFDFERFRSRISAACLACGMDDPLMSDEIAFSLEYALRRIASNGKSITDRELEYYVSKALENSGLAPLAMEFLRISEAGLFMPATQESISGIIERTLKDSDQPQKVCEQVCALLKMMNVPKCTPGLAVELARFVVEMNNSKKFGQSHLASKSDVSPKLQASWNPTLVCLEDFFQHISQNSQSFILERIAYPLPIRTLFSSVSIEISMPRLCERFSITPPTTELVLFPAMQALRSALLDISDAALGAYAARRAAENKPTPSGAGPIPVFLKFPDLNFFLQEYLRISHDNGMTIISEIFSDMQLPANFSAPELNSPKEDQKQS